MSKGLIYCHICGKILQRGEVQQIVHRNFDTKKEKLMFDLCGGCLQKIADMEIPIDNLKLRTTSGKRFWTENQIRDYIFKDSLTMLRALKTLYKYQTEDEKKARETKYDNNVGFNKPDSSFLTGMSKKYIALCDRIYEETDGHDPKVEDVEKEFTEKQLETIKTKLEKYIAQLTTIANA